MEKSSLLENEEILMQSKGDLITLTNFRLRYSSKGWGKSHMVSLMLEKISSIEVKFNSFYLLLILSILSIGLGIVAVSSGIEEQGMLFVIGGLVLFFFFFGTRKRTLNIISDGGGKINFRTKGMKKETVLDFVNQTEKAIKKRREELK